MVFLEKLTFYNGILIKKKHLNFCDGFYWASIVFLAG